MKTHLFFNFKLSGEIDRRIVASWLIFYIASTLFWTVFTWVFKQAYPISQHFIMTAVSGYTAIGMILAALYFLDSRRFPKRRLILCVAGNLGITTGLFLGSAASGIPFTASELPGTLVFCNFIGLFYFHKALEPYPPVSSDAGTPELPQSVLTSRNGKKYFDFNLTGNITLKIVFSWLVVITIADTFWAVFFWLTEGRFEFGAILFITHFIGKLGLTNILLALFIFNPGRIVARFLIISFAGNIGIFTALLILPYFFGAYLKPTEFLGTISWCNFLGFFYYFLPLYWQWRSQQSPEDRKKNLQKKKAL